MQLKPQASRQCHLSLDADTIKEGAVAGRLLVDVRGGAGLAGDVGRECQECWLDGEVGGALQEILASGNALPSYNNVRPAHGWAQHGK